MDFVEERPQSKGWKARWRSQLCFILFIVVFYNTVVRLVLSQLGLWVCASQAIFRFCCIRSSVFLPAASATICICLHCLI